MTANHKTLRNKRISGSILLEMNIVFMILVLVCGVYCNAAYAVLKNCRKLLADIEIAQAVRFTESILRRELSYNSTQVKLAQGFNNKDQIHCQKTFKNVHAYWYQSNNVLYRKTVKNTSSGINPFSSSEIQMTDFRAIQLGKDRIGIIMNYQDPKTGLIRNVFFTLFLSNSSASR